MPLPFLNPWLLIAGVAVAGPVIIHLLNRHRSITVEWGAMMLLRRVIQVKARRIKLQDIWLMILRCLILALVVLAAARPVTKLSGIIRTPDVGVVIALDASMSMAHTPGVQSRFDVARQRVRDIAATVPQGAPISLVLLGRQPRVLLHNIGNTASVLDRVLNDAAVLNEPLNLDQCLPRLQELLDQIKAPARELFVVTDVQRTTFADASPAVRESIRQLCTQARVTFAAVPAGDSRNAAIVDLTAAAGLARIGSLVRYEAVVVNESPQQLDIGDVTLEVDGKAVDRHRVGPLEAGSRTNVSLYASFTRDGLARVTARLPDDALSADDSRNMVAVVRRNTRVLLVAGDADKPDATASLAAALQPSPSTSGVALTQVSWLAAAQQRFADFDLIVLQDVPALTPASIASLQQFIRQGGAAMFLAGDLMKPDSLAALLPAKVIGIERTSDRGGEGMPIDWHDLSHPLLRPLQSLPLDLLNEIRIYRLLQVQPADTSRVLLRTTAGPPLLIEQPLGRGRVLMLTSGVEHDWSSLSVNPGFVLLMQHALDYFAAATLSAPVELPATVVVPLPNVAAGESASLQTPTGESIASIVEVVAGEPAARFELRDPGFYTVDNTAIVLAANAPTAESNVAAMDLSQLPAALGDSVQMLTPEESAAGAIAVGRRGHELWPMLLTAALLLLVLEGFLARRWSRA